MSGCAAARPVIGGNGINLETVWTAVDGRHRSMTCD